MSWKTLVESASNTLLNTYGEDMTAILQDYSLKEVRGIFYPHMKKMYEQSLEFDADELLLSLSVKDIPNPNDLIGIIYKEKEYKAIRHKIEPDGFNLYFLGEDKDG